MATALIGYTGFVGGNIRSRHEFDDYYDSKNIETIREKSYDLIVSAGAPAVVWYANQHPEEDRAILQSLIDNLRTVQAKQFVLISSVDVYPNRIGVNEKTPIDSEQNQAYGKNRFYLEESIRSLYPNHLIVRLPALFGKGIKKNFVYDLLHSNALEFTHKDSIFQYYDLSNLWGDIQKGLEHNIRTLNIAVEPIRAQDMAREVFQINFTNVPEGKEPLRYDMHSVHGAVWGKQGSYLYSLQESMDQLKRFVAEERERMQHA